MGKDARAPRITQFPGAIDLRQALTAPKVVKDMRGRVLEQGDEVLLLDTTIPWRVGGIEPVLDPNVPLGLARVRLIRVQELMVPWGSSMDGIIRTAVAAEFGITPKEATLPGGDPLLDDAAAQEKWRHSGNSSALPVPGHPEDCLGDCCICAGCGERKHLGRCRGGVQ